MSPHEQRLAAIVHSARFEDDARAKLLYSVRAENDVRVRSFAGGLDLVVEGFTSVDRSWMNSRSAITVVVSRERRPTRLSESFPVDISIYDDTGALRYQHREIMEPTNTNPYGWRQIVPLPQEQEKEKEVVTE